MRNLVRDTATPPPRARDIYMKLDAYEQTSAGAGARENSYEGTGGRSRRRRVVISTREGAPAAEMRSSRSIGSSSVAGKARDGERECRRGDATSRPRCTSACLGVSRRVSARLNASHRIPCLDTSRTSNRVLHARIPHTHRRCRCRCALRVPSPVTRYYIVTDVHMRSNTSLTHDSLPFRVFYCFAKKPTRVQIRFECGTRCQFFLMLSPPLSRSPPLGPSLLIPLSLPPAPRSPSVPPFPSYVLNGCDVAAHPVSRSRVVGGREFRRSGRKYIGANVAWWGYIH